MTKFDVRRINRCTAFNVFKALEMEHPHLQPSILSMMRQMVAAMGVEETLARCKFPARIPPDAIELNRLCAEYLFFEEGKPEEAALRAECSRTQKAIAQ